MGERRDYSELPPDQSVRVEVYMPAVMADRLYKTAERYRAVVRGKDEIVQDLIEGFLTVYQRTVLAKRR